MRTSLSFAGGFAACGILLVLVAVNPAPRSPTGVNEDRDVNSRMSSPSSSSDAMETEE